MALAFEASSGLLQYHHHHRCHHHHHHHRNHHILLIEPLKSSAISSRLYNCALLPLVIHGFYIFVSPRPSLWLTFRRWTKFKICTAHPALLGRFALDLEEYILNKT